MRHAVIGAGNLGLDIAYTICKVHGVGVDVYSRSFGQNVLDTDYLATNLNRVGYDVVWYTVGFGSVREAIDQYQTACDIHVNVPVALARKLNRDTKLVVFSSDYAADENKPTDPNAFAVNPRSLYANLKKRLETELLTRVVDGRQVPIVRVGSLFGDHKPWSTFPGRILKNFAPNRDKILLPQNMVTPTPTPWAAAVLADNLDYLFSFPNAKVHHLAPSGSVSVRDWAMFVLSGIRENRDFNRDSDAYYDHARPYFSALGCSLPLEFVPHWYSMWKTFFNRDIYMAGIAEDTIDT